MKVIKIGRGSGNDVVVKDETVSTQHAVLTVYDNNQVTIKDLNSTNGTFVGGNKISQETPLTPGAEVKLGKYVFNWAGEVLNAQPKKPAVQVFQPTDYVKAVSVGKQNCDITIASSEVSRLHAKIYKLRDGSFLLVDQNSTNGTFVNGQKIAQSCKIRPTDQVTVGSGHIVPWQSHFGKISGRGDGNNKTLITIIAAACIALVLGIGYWWLNNSGMSEKEIYKKYNSAVCMAVIEYGFEIKFDGEDGNIHELFGIPETSTVIWDSQKNTFVKGSYSAFGTVFFISEDGRFATNQHIVRPWFYNGNDELCRNIAQKVRIIFKNEAREHPIFDTYIPQVKVEGKLIDLSVLPNGLPISESNLTPARLIAAPSDKDVDCAICQTMNGALPHGVNAIIDYKKAKIDPEQYEQGSKIYTIGFPMSVNLGDTDAGLQNQIHAGIITQDRGPVEFGHDASTAGGASGSPILNKKGELIGIHHAGMSQKQGFNMGIKGKHILDLLQ